MTKYNYYHPDDMISEYLPEWCADYAILEASVQADSWREAVELFRDMRLILS